MPIIDLLLHVDAHLLEWISLYGVWIYAILFLIIYCETGLVVMPFLPGDSLLFALGALAASGAIDPWITAAVIITAAFLGDNTNYFVGNRLGARWEANGLRFVSKRWLNKTRDYYERFGAQTVIIARFIPLVRTFAPFVAGLGAMPYRRFIGFSLLGSLLWVPLFLGAGYLFGNLPFVKRYLTLIILGIVAVSLVPVALFLWREWKAERAERAAERAAAQQAQS